MQQARIGGGSRYLLLAPPNPGRPTQALATLVLGGLSASVPVEEHYGGGFKDLAGFFASMGRSWRGWRGRRTWESLEGELALVAEHRGGVIELNVTLQRQAFGRGSDEWTVRGLLTIEPGDELTRVCQDLAAFARPA
ncbi:MAG: hypothetical protein BGO47_05855 [Microbacterium sp. 67-17]|uniref:DUF6228 family protein n=1 Tax=Microbacterium sp. 67-17 TaxID=1895782 RepID=UPI0009613EF8|nr:DUF6228 family protein [Microbacterium sp. 67-17]OJV93459.1 MAG: hypothetical protein BGO47_05855 [Microbacterium sp. 67-17]